MKNYFFIFMSILLYSCGSVSVTTPAQDGAYCTKLLDDCQSVKDVRKAAEKISRYIEAYEKAFHNGDIVGEQYKEFMLSTPNQVSIENKIVYFQEFGASK